MHFSDARGDKVGAFSHDVDERNDRTNPVGAYGILNFHLVAYSSLSSRHFTRHVDRISLNDMCIEYRMYNILSSERGASSLSFSLFVARNVTLVGISENTSASISMSYTS